MSNAPVLKGSSFTLSILQLFDSDTERALAYLAGKVSQAPAFFAQAPLILNVEQVEGDLAFARLKNGIEKLGLHVVGVVGCERTAQQEQAFAAGIARLRPGSQGSELDIPKGPARTAKASKVVRTPVRSGQQIYAKGRDLVVLGHVSHGAEVIADGSIQIYGTLRGRALAGAAGNGDCHILCGNQQAELISIAGNYWLSEQIDKQFWQQQVLVTQRDDALQMETIRL